jgi:hypothetical protein
MYARMFQKVSICIPYVFPASFAYISYGCVHGFQCCFLCLQTVCMCVPSVLLKSLYLLRYVLSILGCGLSMVSQCFFIYVQGFPNVFPMCFDSGSYVLRWCWKYFQSVSYGLQKLLSVFLIWFKRWVVCTIIVVHGFRMLLYVVRTHMYMFPNSFFCVPNVFPLHFFRWYNIFHVFQRCFYVF